MAYPMMVDHVANTVPMMRSGRDCDDGNEETGANEDDG
jgi:hypothetical protein